MGWPEWIGETGRDLLTEAWLRRTWFEARLQALAIARMLFGEPGPPDEERISADAMFDLLGGL